MHLRDKKLQRNNNRIALLKSAGTSKIILGPNESKDIYCYTDKELDLQTTPAMTSDSTESGLPDFVDITPGLVNYSYGKNGHIIVNVSNLTTNSVVIAPKTIICELQPVVIADDVLNEEKKDRNKFN
ncbi:hypothetical protein DPMN_118597 [Dreissena polymorpha]|uniref:Uncharacterized protein n=1 Tax=Dreissena polymorpha TaxID=45954 RepID=A0A9D4JQE0_DREPO|nr:hypothetical protein DPMN_118597 [Dreissena polymorpha]